MKILIIGNGGREYAIALKLLENKSNVLYFAPGNGATCNLGQNLDINDFEDLADFCEKNNIDLTIVGPEEPLTNGIVNVFKKRNLVIFGPSKEAAKLEGSKVYMKNFLKKYNIKTAKFLSSNNKDEVCKFIDTLSGKIVVKADGLCGGKGVIIANDKSQAKKEAINMLSGKSFGNAGKNVVIEEFLDGYELSFFAICDGKNFVSLPFVQDHKKLNDADMGPNTGGMGAYSPTPLADKNLLKKVEDEILKVTLSGMIKENTPFCGVLFIGLMIVNNEPYVLEYNVRFGDPECEVLMPLIKGDLGTILKDASLGKLTKIELYDKFSVGVVMVSENYPFKPSSKQEINIENIPQNTHICYAKVSLENEKLYANSGRVLVCVGIGDSIKQAQQKAYELCKNIKFKGAKFRKDIAYQALK